MSTLERTAGVSPGQRRRIQATLVASLTLLATIAWAALILGGGNLNPDLLSRHSIHPAGTAFLKTVTMWMVMMVAMMTPGVLPWLGLHTRMSDNAGYQSGALFLAGYFAAWLGYSIAGASLQLTLHQTGVLGADLRINAVAGGGTLILAGLCQFSSLKESCLSKCRNPLSFLLRYWRDGPMGAFSLGLKHGVFCVGCCWAMMAVGFALGLMNLLWMAGITAVIALEQLVSRGPLIGRIAGAIMIASGVFLLAR